MEPEQAKRPEINAEPSESLTMGDVLAQYLEASQKLDEVEAIVKEIEGYRP